MIHNLVEQIVQEVVRRVEAELLREQHPERVAVLVGTRPTSPERMEGWLQSRYGPAYTSLHFGEPPKPPPDRLQISEAVGAAREVILASPDIEQLRRIANGDDNDPVSGAIVRALLWKKKVTILLDYEPPKFRRNTFYETIAGSLETLQSMGVSVEYYEAFAREEKGTDLVTEADVLTAAQTETKTILCAYGAIITPSAQDAIRETGVVLDYKGGSECS